ncbi:MAG: DNA methyltransferase [Candidatus Doudnabacteria bacterium RIFCSPHIGHO2_01_FULL_48_180]|nr:MAG: DNA methyltransferase [Candidatus Doudnabacteria bacterium RIFCSPHIGHO2_01_FULL_48_180]
MANNNLSSAKNAKNDEFYTQYGDIQKEIEAYLEYNPDVFRGKVVYCNCDDPFESNFFRYFVLNFNKLGLKQLITTSYKPSPVANTQLALFGDDKTLTKSKGRPKINANKFIINEVHDIDGDGEFNLKDVAKQLKTNKHNEWTPLVGDGDFRSDECINLLKQSDIVITNPPFSLFREYVKQLFDYKRKLVIIGNMNAITYKEIFPLIKANKLWLGATGNGSDMVFAVPNGMEIAESDRQKAARLGYVGDYTRLGNSCWFTNLDHGRRHKPLPLMTQADITKYSTKKPFKKYDNYNAIEISLVKNIPSDYDGVMGVPISFLDKYNPDQFEILGATQRGCHDEVPDTKKYDDYWEVRQNGKKTGSSGGKTNENANLVGNDGKKNYFINKEGRIIQSAYQRIFIRHKKKII